MLKVVFRCDSISSCVRFSGVDKIEFFKKDFKVRNYFLERKILWGVSRACLPLHITNFNLRLYKKNNSSFKSFVECQPYVWASENYIDCFGGGRREIGHLKSVGNRRKKIKEFSNASRKRFLVCMEKFEWECKSFITLTYPKCIFDMSESYYHLQQFFQALNRILGKKYIYFWKKEFQERGALHYHIVSDLPFCPFLSPAIKTIWESIVPKKYWNPDYNFIIADAEPPKSNKGIRYYISKYVDKKCENIPADVLDVGRWWGVYNQSYYLKRTFPRVYCSYDDFCKLNQKIHENDLEEWKENMFLSNFYYLNDDSASIYLKILNKVLNLNSSLVQSKGTYNNYDLMYHD